MPQISHIRYHDILQAHRFDAEFFKPEYLAIEKKIDAMDRKSLSYYIKNGYRVVYENTQILNDEEVGTQKTVSFLQASDINGYYLNYDLKKVSYTDWERYAKGRITRGEILIEVKGNIEKIALVPDDYPLDVLVSGSLFKFTVNEHITPEVLLIWLTSKYGSYLKNKLKRNVTIHFLGKDDLYNIPVPDFTHDIQKEITRIVKEAHTKQTQSKSLYHQAEQLLLAELGLLDHQIIHYLTFTTTKSAVVTATRYDAEYFQPKYDEIIAKIEQYEIMNLGESDFFEIVTGIYAENYSKNSGKYYIRSVNIENDLNVSIENMYRTDLEFGKKFIVKEGDIITSRVGSIGSLGYINTDLDNSYISDNILRIRNKRKDLNSLFLAFYLKRIGTIFMERLQRGSVQQRLNQETLKEIKIPLITPATQTRIADLITQSHILRRESKILLDDAKRMVEEEIEKS